MKKKIKVIIKNKTKSLIKKIKQHMPKNKYYWKRKYYQTLRELNQLKKTDQVLSDDLRNTYAKYKHYQSLSLELKKKLKKKRGAKK